MHGDEKALDDVAPEEARGEMGEGRGEEVARRPGRPRLHRAGGLARRVRLDDLEELRHFTPEQRLLLLDSWMRGRLPASEFGTLVDVTPTTLYAWRKRFEAYEPAGLSDQIGGGGWGARCPSRPGGRS